MEHKIAKPTKYVNSLLFREQTGCDIFIRGNEWFISGDLTAEQAAQELALHNPPDPQIAIDETNTARTALLTRLGITEEEAKLL